MENVILTIHLILAMGLIGIVLLQRSEGGGLGMGGGGGGGAMTGRQAATPMTKVTWVFAIAFLTTSIVLTVISARNSADSSVVDSLPAATEQAPAPAETPALPEGFALPATSGDAPAAPPRAD